MVLPALQDENFFEWSPARIILIQAGLDWRPSDRIRVGLSASDEVMSAMTRFKSMVAREALVVEFGDIEEGQIRRESKVANEEVVVSVVKVQP